MLLNQNRIELKARHGIYEEATLISGTAKVLPGALLSLSEDVYNINTCKPEAANISGFETAIVLENALLGKAIHAVQYDNEIILVRRPVSGDVYLIRAVAGEYNQGDALYATQTANGIYVSKTGEGKFIGWSQENYTITNDMVDMIDNSTRDFPSDTKVNGRLVNLLRVRIGASKGSYNGSPVPPTPTGITYTIMANGSSTTPTDTITLTFASAPATPITAADISCSVGIGELTQVSDTVYTLKITAVDTGTSSMSISHDGVTAQTVYFNIYGDPAGEIIGYWGVCYPDVEGRTTPTTPAIKAIAKSIITGTKRPMECAFVLNEAEWRAAGGTGDFTLDCAGRAFFITKDWGNATSITLNDVDVSEAFDSYDVTMHAIPYHGYITNGSPIAFDGSSYLFKFES